MKKIVYYSRSGNSKRVAEQLGKRMNLPVYELTSKVSFKGAIGYIKAAIYSLQNKEIEVSCSKCDNDFSGIVLVAPLWAGNIDVVTHSFINQNALKDFTLVVVSNSTQLTKKIACKAQYNILVKQNNENEIIDAILKKQ